MAARPSPGWTRESLVRNREKVVCPLTVATVTLSSPVFTPSPPGSSRGRSRESWVRIAQPPLPAPFQVWAGSARAARRLAGYRRLPVYRVPCVRYCILLLYSEYIMGMKCLRVEYITLRGCAGEKKISCTVYDCFVRARVLKSYYAEKS